MGDQSNSREISDGVPFRRRASDGPSRLVPDGDETVSRASPVAQLVFLTAPLVAGSALSSLLLSTSLGTAWVLLIFTGVGFGCLLLVGPLVRRSDGFRNVEYRRAGELAFLGFLTGITAVVYTLVIHLLLDLRHPWATDFVRSLVDLF